MKKILVVLLMGLLRVGFSQEPGTVGFSMTNGSSIVTYSLYPSGWFQIINSTATNSGTKLTLTSGGGVELANIDSEGFFGIQGNGQLVMVSPYGLFLDVFLPYVPGVLTIDEDYNMSSIPMPGIFWSGRANIQETTSSVLVDINHQMPNTNYTPSISFMGQITCPISVYYSSLTTSNFTANFSSPIPMGARITWSAICSP